MKALWVLYKTEMKLAIREFSGVLFGILMPLGIVLLMGALYGNKMVSGSNYSELQRAIGGVITVGICATGLMGIPITISGYREKKLLRRFQVSPTSPQLLIGVQTLTNFTVATISTGLVLLAARLVYGYEMIGRFDAFALAYLLVVFSIYSLGSLIGSVANSVKTSNLLCSLIYFPMFFLSGATVPYELLPKGLQTLSNFMPLTMGIKLLKGITLGKSWSYYQLEIGVLLVLGLLFTLVSIKTFKYDYE